MMLPVPLLADIEWKIIISIVVGLIYLINYILNAAGKAQPPKPPRAEPRPRPRPQVPVVAAAGGRQELNDEVGEFLRRAAQKRGGGRPAEMEVVRPESRGSQRPRVAQEARAKAAAGSVVEAQTVDEGPLGGKVPALAERHLDSRELAERASHLSHVDQADEEMQSHLQQVFDHQLGSLAPRLADSAEPAAGDHATAPSEAPTAMPTTAEALAVLLSNPQSLRGAVILTEIFRRPTERW